jgi:hypothetical protein
MLVVLDIFSVLIYGVLIMLFFLDIKINKKNLLSVFGCVLIVGLIQVVLYYVYGPRFTERIYPILIHFPLIIFFHYILKKNISLVLFVLFTAYTLTAPRRWVAEVVASFYNNNPYVLIVAKIIVSIILLMIIYKYLRPYFNRITKYSSSRIALLTVVPALTYCVSYATTVYTDLLYRSNMVVIGLFSIGFNFVFYSFIIAYFIEIDRSFALQTEQAILQMQIETISTQIELYRDFQKQGSIYRHDLRHQLQYLSACIIDNQTKEALDYIAKINKDVADIQVRQYCENNSINLILSAYVSKAQKNNIGIEVIAGVPIKSSNKFIDACVVLANGIDNAINACNKLSIEDDKKIVVKCKYEKTKLMIEICNNFKNRVIFEEDLPITTEKNRGLGVKSIVATVKKYQGLYSFSEQDGIFTMRVIM